MAKLKCLLLKKKKLILTILLLRRRRLKPQKEKRRFWIRRIYSEREFKGEYALLVKDMMLYDHHYFFAYFRMSPSTFENLLSWIAPIIIKKTTRLRQPINECERLCVTLRYLVTGDAQTTIAANYRMSPTTVGRIISETCKAIWDTLISRGYLKYPTRGDDWKLVAKEFFERWNFPNAIGAIDGKHVVMQAPHKSGSSFFNYKKTHSIVLMAICNAKYEFTMVDIGDSGRQSDGSVYNNSQLGYAIEQNLIDIPDPHVLPNSERKLPFVFVADDAFGLKTFMMKPYPFQNLSLTQRVFNYRLSRARRIIENAFGITASRFRVFRRPIIAKVENVILITKAAIALHNFLISLNSSSDQYAYCPTNFVDQESPNGYCPGTWRDDESDTNGLQPLEKVGSNNYSKGAAVVRDEFKNYFNNEGAVEWQMDIVTRVGT